MSFPPSALEEATLPPFQGSGPFRRYSQGVTLGYIIRAFQADGSDPENELRSGKPDPYKVQAEYAALQTLRDQWTGF